MNFQIVQPDGFLKNFIRHYCFMESDIIDVNITERVIPTENIQLMFHYKDPFVVHHSHNAITKQPRSILSGLNDSFSDVSTSGETGVAFVSFYTTGACHFFNFPLSEIENQSVDMSDISGMQMRNTEELLYYAKSIKEKVSVIENFLISRYSPISSHDSLLIQKGVETIKKCKGQISTTVLSEMLLTTPKTLERKFSRYLGKTTKQMIKLLRFQGVLQDFSLNKNCTLTERALNNGYFDQSHFIHEFKMYSGYTPGEFAAKYPDFNLNAENC